MSKNLPRDIGAVFKEKIDTMEQTPSNYVWEKLEKSLKKKPTNKKIIFYVILSFLFLTTASSLLFNYINTKSKKSIVKSNTSKKLLTVNETNFTSINNIRNDSVKVHSFEKIEEGLVIKTNSYEFNKALKNKVESNNTITKTNSEITFDNSKKNIKIKHVKSNIKTHLSENDKNKSIDKQIKTEENKLFNKSNSTYYSLNKMKVSIVTPDIDTNEIAQNKIKDFLKTNNKLKKIDTLNNLVKSKNIDSNKTTFSNFFLTAYTTYEQSNFLIQSNTEFSNAYDNGTLIKEREREINSKTQGFLIGYNLNKKWAVQSGFNFTKVTVESEASKIYAQKNDNNEIGFRYNTSIGYAFLKPSFVSNPMLGDSLMATESEHYLNFLSIPILLKYTINNKKWSVSPTVGFSINCLTKSLLETELYGNNNTELEVYSKFEGVKKISYSLMLSTDIKYNFYKNYSLITMPYFKYSIGSVNKKSIVDTKPYFFGVGIGVNYNFNNRIKNEKK